MKNTDLVIEFTNKKTKDLDEAIKKKVPFTKVLDYYHIKWVMKNNSIICKCPFHADIGENMLFSQEKGIYKCFACGESGDIFKFVQSMERCTDNQTYAKMCAIGGITDKTIGLEKADRINARVELCARSGFSECFGIGSVKGLVETAKLYGITALALCDEYSTAGYKEFAFYCKQMAIDAIFGATLIIDKKRVVVLAKNKKGITAINNLITISKPNEVLDASKKSYSNDYSDLEKYKDDIITIGILDKYEYLDEFIERYDLIGAKDNGVGYPKSFYSMSLDNRIVAISDSYYFDKSDKLLYDSLLGFSSYYSRKLKNKGELLNMFPTTWVENNPINAISEIEDDCFSSKNEMKFPKLISDEEFSKLVNGIMTIDFKKESDLFKDHVNAELKNVIENGYASIYYLMFLISEYAHKRNQTINLINSAAASYLTYVLGISDINPKLYNLVPETFLGYDFDVMPDFDIKIAPSFANECEEYLKQIFKENNIIKVGRLSFYSDQEALEVVKKYLSANPDEYYDNIKDTKVFKLSNTVKGIEYNKNRYVLKNEGDNFLELTPLKKTENGLHIALNDVESFYNNFYDISVLTNADLEMINDFKNSGVVDYDAIPLDDEKVFSLFASDAALDKKKKDLPDELTNQLWGISEFGTPYAKAIISACKPKSLDDLIKISSFAHGVNVWNNNGQYLMKNGYKLEQLLASRDDVFNVLTQKYFVSRRTAFMIMEDVRKGRGLRPQFEKVLIGDNVPEYLIVSLKNMLFMSSKAMNVTYAINAYKQMYFKIYYPEIFYASLINNKYIDIIGKLASMSETEFSEKTKLENFDKQEAEVIYTIYEMKERGYCLDYIDEKHEKVKAIKDDTSNNLR